MLDASPRFRRIKGHAEMPKLVAIRRGGGCPHPKGDPESKIGRALLLMPRDELTNRRDEFSWHAHHGLVGRL